MCYTYDLSAVASLGHFESSLDLFEAICNTRESKLNTDNVEFDEEKITLVIKTKIIHKPITWSILLHRFDVSGDQKSEELAKQVEKLTARVQQLEQFNIEELFARVNQLEKFDSVELAARVNQLDKFDSAEPAARVKHLEQHNPEELAVRVKPVKELLAVGEQVQRLQFAAVIPLGYTLSLNRTLVTKTGTQSGPHWQGFLSEQPLSAVGRKFLVAFAFDKVDGNGQFVGVAKRNTMTISGLHSNTGTWMFGLYGGNKYSFSNNSQWTALCPCTAYRSWCRVTVSVSASGLLSFKLDGRLMHQFQLPDTEDLYAAVDLYAPGTSAFFV